MATKTNKEKIDLKKLAEAVAKLAETLPERTTEGRETIKSTLQAQALHIRVLIKKKYRAIDIVQLLKDQGFNITPKVVRDVFAQVEKENIAATADSKSSKQQSESKKDKKQTNKKSKGEQQEISSDKQPDAQKDTLETKKEPKKEPTEVEDGAAFNLEDRDL